MSKDNLKKIEILYFIKAFLQKDFPRYLSKNFSNVVMKRIKEQKTNTYFENFTRLAVAASFAVVTLLLIKVVAVDNLDYPQNSVSKTQISVPTYNTSNQVNKDCKEENQKYNKECCVN